MTKIHQRKTGKKIYADGKGRNTAGQYGQDQSSEFFGGDAVFYQADVPLKLGDYDFGSVAMHVGKSGISFSATAKTGNVAYALVNQPLPIYLKERGLDKDTVDSITDHIRSRGIDVSNVMVKDIAIEGPAASVGFGIGNQASVGGKLSAQISALRFGLTTSLGEIDLKIKFGAGIEKFRKSITAKKDGKPGVYEETTHSAGMIEMIIREKQPAPELSEHIENLPETLVTKSVKKAESFVKSRNSKPEKTVSSSQKITQEDITELLDEDARSVAEAFERDGAVQRLYHEYLASDNSKKYATFYSKVEAHLTSERKFDELMQTTSATSMFFAQVAVLTHNRDLAIGAKVLSVSTQTLSGFKEIGNSVNLLQAGGLSITSFGSLMSGAGAVLGAFNALSSLFGDEEDGLGEALAQISQQLAQIHQTIYEMWGDVRERFESTWKMLETMEEHDQKRFELTLKAIRYVHDELKAIIIDGNQNLEAKVDALDHKIENYLGYLTHKDIRETISNIRKDIRMIVWKSEAEFKLWVEGTFRSWTVKIEEWLTMTAVIENGAIPTRNHQLTITDTQLIDDLEKAMSYEYQSVGDIRLGMFSSLATQFDPKIILEKEKIINPRGWQYVLEIYEDLWMICVEKGWPLDDITTAVYLAEMSRVSEVAHYNFKLLQSIANSKSLWQGLVSQYQENFDTLRKEIKSLQPKPAEGYTIPKEIFWDLSKSAEDNIAFFNNLPTMSAQLSDIKQKVSWVGLRGIRDPNRVPRIGYAEGAAHVNIPQGDINFSLTEQQYNVVLNIGDSCKSMEALRSSSTFLVANAYKLSSLGLLYAQYNVGGWAIWGDFTIYVSPSVMIKNDIYQLCYAALFRSYEEGGRWNFGSNAGFTSTHSHTGPFGPRHGVRDNFDIKILTKVIEEDLLIPFRKSISKEMFSTETSYKMFFTKLKVAYYSLIAFIQLFDTNFNAVLTPRILLKIENEIRKLSASGSAEDLRQLLELVEEKAMKSDRTEGKLYVWQEELREYLALEFEPFDSEYLRSTVITKFEEISWVNALKEAPVKIEKLKQLLLENPYGVAKAITYANEVVSNQQRLLYQSYLVLTQGMSVLSALNQFSSSRLLLWNETLQNTISQESKMEWLALPYYESTNSDVSTTITPLLHGAELQKLCSDQNAPLLTIQELLSRLFLEDAEAFKSILNTAITFNLRPLYLAIRAKRADVVSLLLDYDAKVINEDFSAIESEASDEASQRILALLDIHQHLQSFNLGEDIEPGRTLALIRAGVEKLKHFIGSFKDGIVFLGKTSTGKSTIVNALLGVEYEQTEDGLKPKPGYAEKTSTSNAFSSETTYPELFEYGVCLAADMPGSNDSRGASYEVAAGITVQMLNKVFQKIKLMVFVLTPYYLFDARGKDLTDVFNMYGAIIGSSTECMNNVLFLINKKTYEPEKSVHKIIERLQKMANSKDLTEDAKFLIRHIKEKHILIGNVPDPSFRQIFSDIVERTESLPISKFNLASFHRHVEGFKRLMCRLEEYVALNKAHYNSVSTAIAKEQADHISMVRDLLEEKFLTKVPYEKAMPPAETKLRDNLNEQLANHNALKEKWLSELFNPMLEMITSYVNSSTIDRIGSLQVAQQFSLRMEVASNFLQEMQKIGVEYTQQCTLTTKAIEAEMIADGSSTQSSGSFGIPGAGAIEIDMSNYLQDADGFWFYQPPVVTLQNNHSQITSNSAVSFLLPEVRQFAGKTQASCVYQWQYGLQYILPKTTHLTNGDNHDLLPMPFCSTQQNRIELRFWRDSFMRLSKTDLTVQVGQTLSQTLHHGKLSFSFGATDSFCDEMMKQSGITNQRAQLISAWIHLSLLYQFYGELAVGIHLAGQVLKSSSLGISEQATKNVVTFLVIASNLLHVETFNAESALYLMLPLLISYFVNSLGQKAGREAAKIVPRVYNSIQRFFETAERAIKTKGMNLRMN